MRHFCFVSNWFFFFIFFLARFIAVVSIVSIYLVCDFSIGTICQSFPAARLVFCLSFTRFVFVVLSGESKQNQGRGLVDRKLVQAPAPPINFIAGRPEAALLFCFGEFRCGLLLFMIILVICKYKNR